MKWNYKYPCSIGSILTSVIKEKLQIIFGSQLKPNIAFKHKPTNFPTKKAVVITVMVTILAQDT